MFCILLDSSRTFNKFLQYLIILDIFNMKGFFLKHFKVIGHINLSMFTTLPKKGIQIYASELPAIYLFLIILGQLHNIF